jgi:hypothetical protein
MKSIKFQPNVTVCRYLFTIKSLYMFQVSQQPSSGVLKTVTAASCTGHDTGTGTVLIRPLWREVAVPVCEYFINLLHPLHLHITLLTTHIYYPKSF